MVRLGKLLCRCGSRDLLVLVSGAFLIDTNKFVKSADPQVRSTRPYLYSVIVQFALDCVVVIVFS
jgi:hypothetical protein